MKNRFSGVALVTVIIFILLLSIIAIAMLNLMTNQAMLIEHQIRRIKAQYVAEAALWQNIMTFAVTGLAVPVTPIIINDPETGIPYQADVSYNAGSAPIPGQTDVVVNY